MHVLYFLENDLLDIYNWKPCHHDTSLAVTMMTSSNGNIFRVTGHLCGNSLVPGEFLAQGPVTRSFDVFFDLRPNKRLSKQSSGRWYETLPCPLWRHRNDEWHLRLSQLQAVMPPVMTKLAFWQFLFSVNRLNHYGDVIMSVMTSQITSLTIVYSTVYSGADQRKHQSSASLAFVRGIHRWPVNSPHKWPVTRKMFPFDDVIMLLCDLHDVSSDR